MWTLNLPSMASHCQSPNSWMSLVRHWGLALHPNLNLIQLHLFPLPLGKLSHLRIFHCCRWPSVGCFGLFVCFLTHQCAFFFFSTSLGSQLKWYFLPRPFRILGLNGALVVRSLACAPPFRTPYCCPGLMSLFPAGLENPFSARNAENRLVLFTPTANFKRSTSGPKHTLINTCWTKKEN